MASSRRSLRHRFVGSVASLHHEHHQYKWWVLLNVMLGTFMAVLDSTIVNVALPKIMAAFGADIDTAEWVITAYMLVFAVMLPASGWFADHFGFKRIYFAGLLLFTLGSFLCGFAWDENVLIVFRVIQGAGAGLLMPVGMAIVTREFPVEQRATALGFWGIASAASVSLGPLIGGYLVDNLGWNAIFYVNVPVGMIALFATLVIQREYRIEDPGAFDAAGFVSMAVFLASLLLALADGNAGWNTEGWTSPFIIICFAIAGVSLIVFFIAEFRAEDPLVDLRLLKNFNFGVANIVMFIFGMGMFGSTFLLPVFLQTSLGYTAFQAGAMFLPAGIIQAAWVPFSGIIADKLNPKIPIVIGMGLLGLGLYMNSSLSLYSETQSILIPLFLRGFGLGLVFSPLMAIALSEISRHKMARASGLFNVIRQIGGSFGVALMGSLLTQRTIFHQAVYGQAVQQSAPVFRNVLYDLTHFAQTYAGSAMSTAFVQARILVVSHVAGQAFVQAIDDDFLIAAAISFVGILPIFLLRVHKKKKAGAPPPME